MENFYYGKDRQQLVKVDEEQPETPDGWVAMQSARPIDGAYVANSDGTWSAVKDEVAERNWRDSELERADIEVSKADDIGASSLDWRAYRVALREYPQQVGFPDVDRPTAP